MTNNLLICNEKYLQELFQHDKEWLRELLIELHSTNTFLTNLFVEMQECEKDPSKELDETFCNFSFLNLEKLKEVYNFIWSHLSKIIDGKETITEVHSKLSLLYDHLLFLENEHFTSDEQTEAENYLCAIRREQKEVLDATNEGEEESSDEIEEEEQEEG